MWTILSFEYVLQCYINMLYYNCILEWALATNFPLVLSEYCFRRVVNCIYNKSILQIVKRCCFMNQHFAKMHVYKSLKCCLKYCVA